MKKCSYIIPKTNLQCKRNKSVGCDFCYQHIHLNAKNKKEEKTEKKSEENKNVDDCSNENCSIENCSIENCSICLDKKTYSLIILQCTHTFHEKCLLEWTKQNIVCPLCRQSIITYTIQKTKKSKPIQKDFKKELHDKYFPHLQGLTDLLNIMNMAFVGREQINIRYGFIKSISEYLLADGKYVIMYEPKNKNIFIELLTNFIEVCSEVCPEYVAEISEFSQKISAL